MTSDKDTDWIYRKSTKKLLMRLLLLGCGISVLLELAVPGRDGKFGIDGWFGFYAALGFVSCTLMIFAAKGLGLWLKVPTDFYEEGETGDEDTAATSSSTLKKAAGKNAPPKDHAKKEAARRVSTKQAAGKVVKKGAKKTTRKKVKGQETRKPEGGSQ